MLAAMSLWDFFYYSRHPAYTFSDYHRETCLHVSLNETSGRCEKRRRVCLPGEIWISGKSFFNHFKLNLNSNFFKGTTQPHCAESRVPSNPNLSISFFVSVFGRNVPRFTTEQFHIYFTVSCTLFCSFYYASVTLVKCS